MIPSLVETRFRTIKRLRIQKDDSLILPIPSTSYLYPSGLKAPNLNPEVVHPTTTQGPLKSQQV
jgi:hypothetical protein